MEKKSFKKKLTLSISSLTKKKIDQVRYAKSQNKNSVIVEKKNIRPEFRKTNQQFNRNNVKSGIKTNKIFYKDLNLVNKDSEKRKLAEQKATRRAKGQIVEEKAIKGKKSIVKKREYKLTLSRALDEDNLGFKSRSLASIKRAKRKENNAISKDASLENGKPIIRNIDVPKIITIRELANRMAEQASSLIKHLLSMGVTATINHSIDSDTAEYLIKEFGHNPIREEKIDIKIDKTSISSEADLKKRAPIVTVMGHVDHGKTSLLDAIRDTDVVSGEHGGITQHIGAHQVNINNEKITFIDTPGHAAFTEMRARGSKLTDIVVLVVAADDGVKPQTVEAIKHAKAAKVPIVVAITKCDLHEANPQNVKNQLLEYELIAEELSGDTLFSEVSSKTKKNLNKIKENILLQAELLDLKADYKGKASGVILESKIDTGRGPISTVIVINGTLKKGDYFVSGPTWGKIRALINDKGTTIEKAIPSTPVEILGMDGPAKAGDDFIVVENESKAKEINVYRKEKLKSEKNSLVFVTQDSAFKDNQIKELNIIIKSDVQGSSEAIKNAILNIKNEEVLPKIIHSATGLITETDVSLARASNAVLIAFNVKPSKEAKRMAEHNKIEIKYFNIIYETLDFIKSSLSNMLKPSIEEKVTGSAEVMEIFKVSKFGKVAGSKVVEGEINQDSNARLIRDGNIVYTGKISSIYREKNAAKQVGTGLECGIILKDFADYKKKDIIEAYSVTTFERRI
jgi:translation initiation factor IF-2|tara:strand:+ start:1805 stop:4027 length:2223 start_codon:yes stop_codon:yes gene_type:complete